MNKNKAQSFLEYSLLIAVAVVALIIMQHYFGRGVMGLLKQNVDNLGGEKITTTQFTPGKWYGAKSVARISSSGLDYEGRMGFGVSIGSFQRSFVGKITNNAQSSELAPQDVTYQSQVNGDAALMNQAQSSGFDTQSSNVAANVEQNTKEWHNSSTVAQDPMDEGVGDNTDRQAQNVVNAHVEQSSVPVQ